MAEPSTDATKLNKKSWPQNSIQKISQEGSKNTYVIILSKDSIRPTKGPPVIKHPPAECDIYGKQIDEAFDSPTIGLAECRISPKSKGLKATEDVRLNLSNIEDDEYDSNVSASNVFLTADTFDEDQDSAIQSDIFQPSMGIDDSANSANNTQPFFCAKSKMNTYFIQSPLAALQQQKRGMIEQHAFPMISPQCVGNRQSKLVTHTTLSDDPNPTARQIFVVNQAPANLSNAKGPSVVKKTVSYTNTAVPMVGKTLYSTPVSHLSSITNPKAVPTLRNISPIHQQVYNNMSNEKCAPTNTTGGSLLTNGPLTSTPVLSDTNSKQYQSYKDNSTHHPVYIIPSPFVKQRHGGSSVETKQNNSVVYTDTRAVDSSMITIQPLSTSSLNNSSGFVSGSCSSWDLHDGSQSFDADILQSKTSNKSSRVNGLSNEEVLQSLQAKGQSDNFSAGGELDSQNQDDESIMDLELCYSGDSEIDPFITSSQESLGSDASDKAGLNRSLTNMQWLKGMQLKEEKANSQQDAQQKNIQWKTLSAEEIQAISKECGVNQRPPFSYMVMIQMALRSRPDHKMMLKEICKWIEETFPYYKNTAKPGWKSSIRHNLSLYNIFEREPVKRHGSYWTIRSDREPRAKQYQRDKAHNHTASSPVPNVPPDTVIPIIPMYSSMGQLSAISPQPFQIAHHSQHIRKKKAPPRILPRPSASTTPQTYALIPISNVNQQMNLTSPVQPQQQVYMSLAGNDTHSACPSPGISEMSAAVASIQMTATSPVPSEASCESPIIFQQEHIYNKQPMSLIRQTWLECQSSGSASSFDSEAALSTELVTSNELVHSNEFHKGRTKSKSKVKRPRDKPTLPKPTLYKGDEEKSRPSGSKRRKLLQKERPLSNDSSDEEDDDGTKFISNLEKDILTKPAFVDDQVTILTTSTPVKPSSHTSSQLPSPIRGLTPLRNSSLFEGSFLETLGDRKALGLSPDPLANKHTKNAGDSFNSSLLDFHVLPFTSPDKLQGSPENNQNLSRFLNEYGLDPSIVDNPDNWNWSVVQQLVDDNLDAT